MAASDTEALVAAAGSSGRTGAVAVGGAAVGGAAGSTVPGVGVGCVLGLGFGSFVVFCPSVPFAGGFGDVEVAEGPGSAGVGGGDGSAGASD